MKNYDTISLILTLKKRWILFIITFFVCLIIGEIWAKAQINIINNKKLESYKKYTQDNKILESKTILLKVLTINDAVNTITNDILSKYINSECISDFKLYTKDEKFSIYALIAQDEKHHCINELLDDLNNNIIIKEFTNKKHIFSILGTYNYNLTFSGKPPNKHYIYLDPDRITSEEGYHLTSTQIISAHTSLNSNKIYIFVAITAIMIALFITFGIESFLSIKTKIDEISKNNI